VVDRFNLLALTLPVTDGALELVLGAIGALDGLAPEVRHDLALVTRELVANVVDHAGHLDGDEMTVSVTQDETRLLLEVGDHGPGFTVQQAAENRRDAQARQLGLFIVDQFSDGWGVRQDIGFTVWAEIALTR
jgi:anti-sigma regulatory factor (Ser/Thr protein kinase)